MTTDAVVAVSPLQQKLKQFCVWIETKFECRIPRAVFAVRMALAFVVFGALHFARSSGFLDAHWLLGLAAWVVFGWAAFWTILQIVRRFHDLGRTGGLFWAVAIPFWVSWRIADLFHLTSRPDRWWAWILLAAFCLWSFWLTFQLFLRAGTDGPNGYDGREFYKNLANP